MMDPEVGDDRRIARRDSAPAHDEWLALRNAVDLRT